MNTYFNINKITMRIIILFILNIEIKGGKRQNDASKTMTKQ